MMPQRKAFAFVGPLIDVAGAKRCAGFLKEVEELLPKRSSEESLKLHGRSNAVDEEFPMDVVESAVAAGRSIVLVSMGTVITGDSSNHGWEATDGSSMTGKQLCQAVFKAVFAELGDPAEGGGNLLVVAVGPQADALEGVEVPANALCRNTLPQVDILRFSSPTGARTLLWKACSLELHWWCALASLISQPMVPKRRQ